MTAHAGEDGDQGEHSPLLVGVQVHTAIIEITVVLGGSSGRRELIYLKIQLNHSWVYTQRMFHPNTEILAQPCSLMLYSLQTLKTTYISCNRRMGQENMAHLHHGELLSH